MNNVLIIGLPNAGKTTYADEHFKNVLHLDNFDFPRFANLLDAIKKTTGAIVAEGVINTAEARKKYLAALGDREGKRVCIWINTSFEECLKRSRGNRPAWVVKYHYGCFEKPSYSEGWDEIKILNGVEKND